MDNNENIKIGKYILSKDEIDYKELTKKYVKNEKKFQLLEKYVQAIEKHNSVMNLTAFKGNKLWEEGILESLITMDRSYNHLNINEKKLLDIGSGVGFPSIPYIIVHPEIELTIFEPLKKRAVFLKEITKELKLNVEVYEMKIQRLNRVKVFDLISARAVANLKKLFPIAKQLIKDDGLVSLIKGPKVFKEIKELDLIWNRKNFAVTKVNAIKTKKIYLFNYSFTKAKLPKGAINVNGK